MGRSRPEGPGPASDQPDGRPSEPAGPTQEELAARVGELRKQLAEAPVETVVANHCYGLFELAALHLSLKPPKLEQARLAIDAMAALVQGLEGRLGAEEPGLREGLAQLQVAFVRIRHAQDAGGDGSPG